MPTYAGQIDVEIEASDEEQAEAILNEVRKSVARNPEVEHATASGVECLYDCADHYDFEEDQDEECEYEDCNEPPF